jgi:hypothetical protein
MGHEDITVLKQYLALAEFDLRAAHAAAAPVDKMLGFDSAPRKRG